MKRIVQQFLSELAVGMNYHFNVQAVKCPSCGSSFDATKSRFCPFCNQPLNMLLQDWVMVECRKQIRRKRADPVCRVCMQYERSRACF